MLKKRNSRECGSVTIEATISLTAFMFAIITLLTVLNICLVQAKMSIAINATAKEISQYSYLYALTGLNESHAAISEGGKKKSEEIDGIITNVNIVFTEIQNIGSTGKSVVGELAAEGELETDDISTLLKKSESSMNHIKESSGELKDTIASMAKDPKGVAFGLAKMIVSDGWDWAMTNLVAAPISKLLCQKNLVAEKGGDVEAYLKSLGVRPAANGSYLDGLDFSRSKIFPKGSNEIIVNVAYDVDIIALLPIDFSFHFNQTAITHGWLTGKDSYRTTKDVLQTVGNNSIWVQGDIAERSSLIRKQGIQDLMEDGYEQICADSFSDVHAYNPTTNTFAAIHSSNPLYSAEGERTLTLDDINDTVIRNDIETWCSGIAETSSSVDKVYTKKTENGTTTKQWHSCENASAKIIIVVPADKGLLEKYQSILQTADTRGVKVEVIKGYGSGARTTVVNETAPAEGSAEGGKTE